MAAVLLFLLPLDTSVYADSVKLHTVKLFCSSGDVTLSSMDWSVYRVGSLNSDGSYSLEGVFEEYPVPPLNDQTTSYLMDIASTLENYAIIDGVLPDRQGTTDSNGTITFTDLTQGLYLFSGTPVTIGDKKYIPSAFLTYIDDNSEELDVNAYAKFTVSEVNQGESEYTVRKVWIGDEDAVQARPHEITVAVYKDRVLEDTVTLNESNDWQYSWTYTGDVEWRVKEVEVDTDYSVVYRTNETQYLIVNYHDDYFEDSTGKKNNTNSFSQNTLLTLATTTPTTDYSTTDTNGSVTSTNEDYTTTDTIDSNNPSYTTTDVSDSNLITSTDTNTTLDTTTTNPKDTDSNSPKDSTKNTDSKSTDSKSTSNSNNANGNSTVTTTNSNLDKLPQTGQLWWPVPVLAVVGLVSIAVGCQLKSRD
jgi:hypothetical protein